MRIQIAIHYLDGTSNVEVIDAASVTVDLQHLLPGEHTEGGRPVKKSARTTYKVGGGHATLQRNNEILVSLETPQDLPGEPVHHDARPAF